MKRSTKIAMVAPHQIDTVPIEVIALLHDSTTQPSAPFFGPSQKNEVGRPWISHDHGLVW